MLTDTQNNKLHIPTREQFHSTYAGKIYNKDFNFTTWEIIVDAILDDKIFDSENIRRAERRNAENFLLSK